MCCLQVRDPAKYNWNPKQLLTQICSVYLNLYRADKQGVFAAAIAADARSYRPQMFAEASHVLRQFQLMSETEVGGSGQ
jgi:ubiquitin conjugation factor E4 B